MCLSTTNPQATEILVQDDNSPNYNLLEVPLPPPIKPARNQINYGFAGNCNAGATRAQGDYLIFVNQDIVPTHPGWLDEMVAVFEDNDNVGIVGPKLLFPDGKIQSCGGIFNGNRTPEHRYLGWANKDDRRVNTTERVSWITGAAMMMRREDFFAVGGFDMGYSGGYFEDVDLCMKVKEQLGKDVWYCASAELVHEVGSTGGNPNFMQNAKRFKGIWGSKIVSDTQYVKVGY